MTARANGEFGLAPRRDGLADPAPDKIHRFGAEGEAL